MTEEGVDFDIEDVLNPEDENYQIGYRQGQQQSARQQYLEGKQYGYQTGFQRFLIVGYIQELILDWENNCSNYSNWAQLSSHLGQLRELVFGLSLTNGQREVEDFEKKLKLARNKLRVIVSLTKESWKINRLDELVKEVAGELQVGERNVDDW